MDNSAKLLSLIIGEAHNPADFLVFFYDIGSIPVLEDVYRSEDESYIEEYFPLGCDGM